MAKHQGMRCLHSITDAMNMNLDKLWEMVRDREACCAATHGVATFTYFAPKEPFEISKSHCHTSPPSSLKQNYKDVLYFRRVLLTSINV